MGTGIDHNAERTIRPPKHHQIDIEKRDTDRFVHYLSGNGYGVPEVYEDFPVVRGDPG
jgi:hypothetical protein